MNRMFWSMLCASTFAGSTCLAGFTSVGKINRNEASQEQILEHAYGGDFVRNGLDYTNGSITARRVADDADQTLRLGKTTFRAVARFSDYEQCLSVDGHGEMFEATGSGFSVAGSAAFDGRGLNHALVRHGDGAMQSSIMQNTTDGRDHMISYEIQGVSDDHAVWLTFWEDLDWSASMSTLRTYADFNDLAVEVRSVIVPLPAAAWAMLATGGMIFAARKRVRRFIGV